MLTSRNFAAIGLKLLQLFDNVDFASGRAYVRDSKGRFARSPSSTNALATASPPQPKRLAAVSDKPTLESKLREWGNHHEDMSHVFKSLTAEKLHSELKDAAAIAQKRKHETFKLPKGVELSAEDLRQNRQYHNKNYSLNPDKKDNSTFFRFNDGTVGGIISKESDGLHHVSLKHIQGTTKTIPFKSEGEAEKYLRQVARDYADARIIPSERAEHFISQSSKNLEEAKKKAQSTKYSKQDPETLFDNIAIAGEINHTINHKRTNTVGLVDGNGRMQSVAKYSHGKGHIYVDFLATAPWNLAEEHEHKTKGSGARALAHLAKLSIEKGNGGRLELTPLPKAKPFYEHLGFEDDPGGFHMKLSPASAKRLIKKYGGN